MKFFADESLDYLLVELLRKNGYEVLYAAEFMSAADDETILHTATENASILITKDKDFGEMVVRFRKKTFGVILIRIAALNTVERCNYILSVIDQYQNDLPHSFIIIQEDKIRIRRL